MRILGLDPGLRTTGYGVIDTDPRGYATMVEAGVIVPTPDALLEQRLVELYDGLCEIITSTKPEIIAMEELWSNYRHPATAVLMGHARGVLCLAAGRFDVKIEHLSHSLVKRALVGAGAARKDQTAKMVMQLLKLASLPKPPDVGDALALALALGNMLDQRRQGTSAKGSPLERRKAPKSRRSKVKIDEPE